MLWGLLTSSKSSHSVLPHWHCPLATPKTLLAKHLMPRDLCSDSALCLACSAHFFTWLVHFYLAGTHCDASHERPTMTSSKVAILPIPTPQWLSHHHYFTSSISHNLKSSSLLISLHIYFLTFPLVWRQERFLSRSVLSSMVTTRPTCGYWELEMWLV